MDPQGNRILLIDPDQKRTVYSYNELKRLQTLTLDDQQAVTYESFPDGLKKTVTNPKGTVSTPGRQKPRPQTRSYARKGERRVAVHSFPGSLSKFPQRGAALIDEIVSEEPGPGVLGVAFEPGFRRAQAEAVAPLVHVAEHERAPHGGEAIGEKNLEVADRGLLAVVSPRIPQERRPP